MKNRMLLALAGSLPLLAAAGIKGGNSGFVDVGTLAALVLGCIALVLARRMHKR